MTIKTQDILNAITTALGDAANIATALNPAIGSILDIATKVAIGVAAEVPEAIALFNQFKSGAIPTQAELDAYAVAEDGAYAQLMADLNKASPAT